MEVVLGHDIVISSVSSKFMDSVNSNGLLPQKRISLVDPAKMNDIVI